MEDEFPEEFQILRQDYGALKYPGDLPGDLGLVPARPIVKAADHGGWRMGWTVVRWAGVTAAAAAVALAAIGLYHAANPASVPGQLAMNTQASKPTVIATDVQKPSDPAPTKTATPAAVASNTINKEDSADDSIPMWSDVQTSPSISTATAGLPSTSLILPTFSEAESDKAAEQTSGSQSNTKSSL